MITVALFGVGRIGVIHAANLAASPGATLRYIVDPSEGAARDRAAEHGARVATAAEALADAEVQAVVIATSTDTHAGLIEAAARAGKAIFTEKPIDLTLSRVRACLEVVEREGVLLAVGFNRRFDPSFRALKHALDEGRIGKPEIVSITSRDPAPPPVDFIKTSGGLFRDMMIHDFDMARWLLGEEPVAVHAWASCLVDPVFAELGDVDTAVVSLKTASGALCQINNSRRAAFGYDQRLEVQGSLGMLRAENRRPTSVELLTGDGTLADPPEHFFLERYTDAYRAEMEAFLDAVAGGEGEVVDGVDGERALALAEAAVASLAEGRPVAL
ncbi:MAG: inositol 2-dehydrogenase [Alphaproteobacteria bacterium]|nr:inositol 2-dehydrogenase [Alphaproteobacteria bacterium]